jgi:signal transduction protein with GAF and PtsI domain
MMDPKRIDEFKVKFSCKCGFSEFKPAPARSMAINPNYSSDSLLPLKFDNKGEFFFELQRADRERMEIITLEEISMLSSSDYDLNEVLKTVCQKMAKRLGVDICTIYLWDGTHLVLRATYGLSQDAVGKSKLEVGQGITGSAVEAREPLLIEDVSNDERYKYFSETKEEQYKIKTMYSYPIFVDDKPFGVLNAQTVVLKEFHEDERYFISVIANLVLGAVKMRKKI